MQQRFELDGEIVDRQTFLDGTREFTIEAQSAPEPGEAVWLTTLSFRWLAEIDASIEEGDLSLTGPDGDGVYAAITEGEAESVFDEDIADEVTMLSLRGEVRSGEGQYAAWRGTIRVTGRIAGEEVHLEMETNLRPPDE